MDSSGHKGVGGGEAGLHKSVHTICTLSSLFTFPTLLPGGQKLCKITQKGPLKVTFDRGKLVAVWPPNFEKIAENGLENIF